MRTESLVTERPGESHLELILRGARERLGPILMTALVTGLGLAPIAIWSNQAGREIEGPMAIVILRGLLTSRRAPSLSDGRTASGPIEVYVSSKSCNRIAHGIHIIAKKHGGAIESSNLALSCFYCNSAKGPNIAVFSACWAFVKLFSCTGARIILCRGKVQTRHPTD